jgi:DNA-binding CsgD family transcriptional regulator
MAMKQQIPVRTASRPREVAIPFRFNGYNLSAVPLRDWVELSDGPVTAMREYVVGRIRCGGELFIVISEEPAAVAVAERPVAQLLTQRELMIAWQIAEGLTDKEIARKLGISAYTVREHCRRACAKLSISKRSALVGKLFTVTNMLIEAKQYDGVRPAPRTSGDCDDEDMPGQRLLKLKARRGA